MCIYIYPEVRVNPRCRPNGCGVRVRGEQSAGEPETANHKRNTKKHLG